MYGGYRLAIVKEQLAQQNVKLSEQDLKLSQLDATMKSMLALIEARLPPAEPGSGENGQRRSGKGRAPRCSRRANATPGRLQAESNFPRTKPFAWPSSPGFSAGRHRPGDEQSITWKPFKLARTPTAEKSG